MGRSVTGGAADVTTYFVLRNTTDGTGKTAITIADIDLQYVRSGVAPVAMVAASALAATDSVHADNKAIEIDATDSPGLYRVDWPDAAFAAGVPEVILTVKVSGAFTEHLAVQIDLPVDVTKISGDATAADNLESACDNYSVTRGLTGTALPAVAADGAGGLPVSDAGGLDLDGMDSDVGEILADTGTDGVLLAATATSAQLVDDVWDEDLTGATHNGATVAGKRLRQASDSATVLHEGTAQAGGSTTITLAAGASAVNDLYHDAFVSILAGTGVGQIRAIIAYDGGTKVATVSKTWATNPAGDSEYVLSGSSSVDLHSIKDSTTAVDNLESACDNYSAERGLTGTALPAAVADAAGGLPISDAGGLDLDDLPTTAEFEARTLAAASYFDPAADTVVDVTNVATLTGHTAQTGDNYDRLGAPSGASVSVDVAAIKAETALIVADTDELQTDDVPGLIAALSNLSATDLRTALGTNASDLIVELSQAKPGATPTIADALMLLYMQLRNANNVTSSLMEITNDAGTVIAKGALSDNGTTFTKAELATGP